ncbi:MAG: anaerobic sulfatase maturase [Bifidobacterium scardovii]|uniref:anaerobic sulfatase maturase n=1 Tax=Bifidobacterium scardovii TaxID=158787 RepID=UPI00290005B3|nr:anaerobic sulfatase maturase [Bifidobacterium scardovii]MDU2420892.1 anaerobic sulfatase maturase [Bifidobacterium scardovii]
MAGTPFSVLVKPTGAFCNLDCEYCFFISKDQVLPGDPLMSEDTLEIFLRRYLDEQPDGEVSVAWQGGEPTLRGVGFFEKALPLAERLARPRQHVNHVLQTNGTLLDDRWCRLLAEHQVLVGISVDGPKDLHDRYRVNRAGHGSHDAVMRGWHLLEDYGIARNVLCTVHAANERHPLEMYRFFRDEMHADHMQFIPIVERVDAAHAATAENRWRRTDGSRLLYRQAGHHVTSRSVKPESWGEFLDVVFDEWVRHDVGTTFVQQFDVMLGNMFGQYSLCVHAPQCGNALVAAHNGDVFSCDHWVEDEYRLGNFLHEGFRDMIDSDRHRRFSGFKQNLPQDCRRCPVLWACQGGCPKDRFLPDGEGTRRLNYLCEGYRMFFTHAMPAMERMAQLIDEGLPAAAIMTDFDRCAPGPARALQEVMAHEPVPA